MRSLCVSVVRGPRLFALRAAEWIRDGRANASKTDFGRLGPRGLKSPPMHSEGLAPRNRDGDKSAETTSFRGPDVLKAFPEWKGKLIGLEDIFEGCDGRLVARLSSVKHEV
jgi:hypothetical protein